MGIILLLWLADSAEKHLSWDLLRILKRVANLPWLIVGDFNQILVEAENVGGAPRSQREMEGLREVLHDYGLQDFRFVGEPFMVE